MVYTEHDNNQQRRVSFPISYIQTPTATTTNTGQPFTSSPPSTPKLTQNETAALKDQANGTPSVPGATPVSAVPRRRANRTVTVDTNGSGHGASSLRRQTSESGRSRRQSVDPGAGVLKRMTTGLFTPDRKIGKSPTYLASFKAAITSSYL